MKKSAITGLTANEEKFTQLLVNGLKNKQAYIESHGIGRASEKTITEKASRLGSKHNIKARFEQLTREQAKRSAIDRDWIVDKLKHITEVGTERIQVVDIKTTKSRTSDEITHSVEERILDKLVDSMGANAALDKLIKMAGLYAAEKGELEIKAKGKFVLNLRDRTDVA